MAAYGAIATGAAGGSVTTLDTANLNISGADLALVCGGGDMSDQNVVLSFVWDPLGNNESMTGSFGSVGPLSGYLDGELEYLDDPTAANAPVRVTSSLSTDQLVVFGVFFTAAGTIVGADAATDSFAGSGGSSLTATPGNVVSGDMVVDMIALSAQNALTVGADQTARESTLDGGGYLRVGVSTQAGADGGAMSWTFTAPAYGGLLIAARIPDAGGGGGVSIPVVQAHARRRR